MEEIIHKFQQQLKYILGSTKSDLEIINDSIFISNNTLVELMSFIEKYDFRNEQEEINFFKNTKPIALKSLIFYSKLRSFHFKIPLNGKKEKKIFLIREFFKINNFFRNHAQLLEFPHLGNISGDKIPIQMLQKLYRHSSVTTTINYQANFMKKEADEALDRVINF